MDVSSLRTATSGECVDISPSFAVRCTISVRRRDVGRLLLHAHVVNDTEETVSCAPGTRRNSSALLQTDREFLCEPHAEIGFLFDVPRFGSGGRAAYVRVGGTTFACGFEKPIEDERLQVAAISLGIAALLVAIIGGVVLYERRKRRGEEPKPRREPPPEPIAGEVLEPAERFAAPEPVPRTPAAVAHAGLEARGFAAVLDEQRVVMGALECTQQRLLSSDFLARVVNQTQEPLLCTVTGRTRRGVVPIASGSFVIHPQSAAAVSVVAPLRLPWRLRMLQLQMESSEVRASAQADVPLPPLVRAATLIAVIALLLGACAVAVLFARPRVGALAVPTRVLAGTPVMASYAVAGVGRARYEVLFGATTITSGTVPAGSGSFSFITSPRPGIYHVTVRMAGLFGSARRSVTVEALARLVRGVASIAGLAIDPAVVAAGAPVRVRYSAKGDGGNITLAGSAGIPLQQAPYSASGVSQLIAPAVDTPTQYQVQLVVARGDSQARATVGLVVVPKALATSPPAPSVPPGMLSAAQLLRVVPSRVVAAHRFTLFLLAHPQNFWITLQDAHGTAVATQSVSQSATSLQLRAPFVRRDERFLIIARFTRGTADQVILDPLTIYAR